MCSFIVVHERSITKCDLDKLSGKIYSLLFKLFISGNRDIPWMNYIKSIFDETGFSNIWDGQKYSNPEFLKVTIKQ
jgi:hypothetical protein